MREKKTPGIVRAPGHLIPGYTGYVRREARRDTDKILRDTVLHMVRLRAFGMYSALFLNRMVGTEGRFRSGEIEDYVRNVIVAKLIDIFGDTIKSIFDMPRYYNEIGIAGNARLAGEFAAWGLEASEFCGKLDHGARRSL